MAAELLKKLEGFGTRFVRVVWCDNANVIRGKAVHIGMLPSYLDHGVGITAAQQAIPVMYDAVVSETGLSPIGEIRLMPDWSTMKPLPYASGDVRVMGDMVNGDHLWTNCPRNFLKRMIAACRDEGIAIQAAFENEFYLFRRGPETLTPIDETVFAATQSMDCNRKVIGDIVEALLLQDIPVELYHPESGPGQHEITTRYTDALAAGDRQIAFRETVHAVAADHDLKASFLPKIFEDKAGSGCHLHFSLWRDEQNITPDVNSVGGLSKTARSFIAGILDHLPALMALTTPSSNSYRRIRPHFWSGAFRCWGVDNREAALRAPSDPSNGATSQLELKTVDASANPYIALGAVLAAGLDGVRRDLEPAEPVSVDPGNLSEAERNSKGIDALPDNLGLAINHLAGDSVLQDALGADLARSYLAVRRAEWEYMKNMELADEVTLLLERY